MNINKVKISNILGIESLEFQAGKFVEVSGANGTGKTSFLEALRFALKGGNDATILRQGADSGEVILEFTDGTVLKRKYDGKSKLSLIDGAGNSINKPQTYLDSLADIMSTNPIEFLNTDNKTRAKILLESIPIDINPDELKEILQGEYASKIPVDFSCHPLEFLEFIRETLFTTRRDLNRDSKEKTGTLNQLQESLIPIDCEPEELQSKINDIEMKQSARQEMKTNILIDLSKELEQKTEELRKEFEEKKNSLNAEYASKKEDILKKFEETYNPATEQLIMLREQLKNVGGVMKSKELIKQFTEEIQRLDKDTNQLTEALNKLEQLKLAKLQNIPIQGLEIKDGSIYVNDISFDRLNTASKINIAVEVAKMKAGKLGIICLDGLENFDDNTYNLFKEAMQGTNLQAIITRVSNEEFTVKSA